MGSKYRRVGWRWINPRDVQVIVYSEAAVQGYMENPDWSGPDFFGNGGKPLVYRNADGALGATVGNHRIAAAARQGRKIKVEFWVERGSEYDPASSDSFFAWMFR